MMTRGIPEHWEDMSSAMGETAVYASLQISLYIARLLSDPFLTGFPVSNEKQTGGLFWETEDNDLADFGHAQYSFDTGYCITAICLFMNIMTAVGVRHQSCTRVSTTAFAFLRVKQLKMLGININMLNAGCTDIWSTG